MKKTSSSMLITLIIFSSLPLLTSPSQAASTPTIYVDPSQTTVQLNETQVSINVSITQALNVSAWEFKLYYKNSILKALTATEGPFLGSGGASTWFWIVQLSDNYNTTHGLAWLTCTQLGNISQGVDGGGTLTTITFKPNGGGNSTLSLKDLVLADPDGNNITPINSTDGKIQVQGTQDTAITSVIPGKTIVGQGYTMRMNVTAENQGDQTETFNITTYANTTAIQTETITLASGNSTITTFTWNTTGFAKGNYTISVYAWPLPSETETVDNNLTDGIIYVGIPGDVDGNQKVEIKDVFAIAKAYGTTPGKPGYDPNLDVNDDDKIDIKDIFITAKNYGQTDP